ncbi:Phosphocholine transferase AnkX [Wolbachia endosymbiont of Cylisticus convexus]|uniref:latrotoxin-related protein n=1 Tax=Wolbachia endosymbiont of Cylisticus convexus TaxID=118728 RepID=UPI000DF6A8F4|nr:PD-(D/E)XK nuclease domain-containing protein [Wolbachia endosymbiont of Cylisticus convexus]RDD35196.1 Phosphocholine transferase AnkX [Wolbachia endosymbiont of Cylisticus convexus]
MPKATAKTKHIEHKPELIELLLTEPINSGNNKGNPVLPIDREKPVGFAEKYSSLLYETPNIGSTSKKEFFIHGLLGSILTLPDSGLMEKLGIDKVYVKHTMRTERGSDRKVKVVSDVIKLCFSFKKDGRKQIALRVFVNDEITGDKNPEDKCHYSDDELKEIAKKLDISDIDNIDEHVFRIRTEGDSNNKLFRLHKWQTDGVKEKFKAAASSQSQVNNEFKEISVAQSINLEDSLKKLSDEGVKEVMGGTKDIFGRLTEVYEGNQEKFSLGNSEAAYHGFHYGALALNFKYRYDLNCYVERTAGNGRADLIFISRTKDANGRMNSKPTPVVVEFKSGDHAVDEAIAQIENKGYLYNLNVRTKAEEAVIVGVSRAKVKTEQAKIFQSRGFLQQLLEVKKFSQNNIDTIKGELKNLYYSIQSHERHYLSKLVLGQVLAVDGNGLDKYIFTYTDQDKSIGGEATTFVLSNKAEGKAVILNIIECSAEQRVPREKKKFDSKRIPPIDELKINSAVKIDVTINTGVEHKPDGFEVEGREAKSYYQYINIEKISGGSQGKFRGQFEKIENVKVGNLVKVLQESINRRTRGNKKRSEEKLKESLSPLAEALFPFKRLIKKEIDFQAIIQGLFINGETEDGKEIRVYMESNAPAQGRMDLALSFTQLSKNVCSFIEDDPIIIELKYATSTSNADKELKKAEKQMGEKYTILRSFTNKKTAKHVAMVFNIGAKYKNDVIKVSTQDVKVDHTSSSSPEKKRPGSPLAGCSKKRKTRSTGMPCIDSGDGEEITKEEKERRIKELFNTDEGKNIIKYSEFYEQFYKVFQQGKATNSDIKDLVDKTKYLDLDLLDVEVKDIVEKFKANVENRETIKEIISVPKVREKVGKISSWGMRGWMIGNILGNAVDDNIENAARGVAVLIVDSAIAGVAGGATPISWYFMARSLGDDIERLAAGDSSTDTIVKTSLDVTIWALSFLAITNPELAPIVDILIIGEQIYLAVKTVEAEDKIVHLTSREKFEEGLRAFFGIQPEKYIQKLMEEGQVGNQLVKNAAEFLKDHSDIKRYVFPTGRLGDNCKTTYTHSISNAEGHPSRSDGKCPEGEGYHPFGGYCTEYKDTQCSKFKSDDNSIVLLDNKRTDVKWSRARLDNPDGGEVFCQPGKLSGNSHEYVPVPHPTYLCDNAIGLSYLLGRTGDNTLIDLGDGKDEVVGFNDEPNIFLVGNGYKNFAGGGKDDVFIINGEGFKGVLDGKGGINVLNLANFAPNMNDISVCLKEGALNSDQEIKNMHSVLGRKDKSDCIHVACNTKYVDGQGGEDKIIIDSENCNYDLRVLLHDGIVIHNNAKDGNFDYYLPFESGIAHLHTYNDSNYAKHAVVLSNIPANTASIDITDTNEGTEKAVDFKFESSKKNEVKYTVVHHSYMGALLSFKFMLENGGIINNRASEGVFNYIVNQRVTLMELAPNNNAQHTVMFANLPNDIECVHVTMEEKNGEIEFNFTSTNDINVRTVYSQNLLPLSFQLVAKPNVTIVNDARNGTFYYIVMHGQNQKGEINFKLGKEGEFVNHIFSFDYIFSDIKSIKLNTTDDTRHVTFNLGPLIADPALEYCIYMIKNIVVTNKGIAVNFRDEANRLVLPRFKDEESILVGKVTCQIFKGFLNYDLPKNRADFPKELNMTKIASLLHYEHLEVDYDNFNITISDKYNKFRILCIYLIEHSDMKTLINCDRRVDVKVNIRSMVNTTDNAVYKFQDGTEVKFINDNVHIFHNTKKHVDMIISHYLEVAHRLNAVLVINSISDKEVIAIGCKGNEIIYNDPTSKSHLVGYGGENLYSIISGKKELKISELPIPEVNIYYRSNLTDNLDLSKVIKQIRNDLNIEQSFNITSDNKDVSINVVMSNGTKVLTVRLKDGADWYQKLHIYLDSKVPVQLENKDGNWKLNSIPGFGESKVIFTGSVRYYQPSQKNLQIYHNQPENKHQIGIIDLKSKSMLDYSMQLNQTTGSLVLSSEGDTSLTIENWVTKEAARKMIFTFNDTIVSNLQCVASTCNPEDIIEEFDKEKTVLKNIGIVRLSLSREVVNRFIDVDKYFAGNDASAMTNHGKTPLEVAREYDNLEVVNFFERDGESAQRHKCQGGSIVQKLSLGSIANQKLEELNSKALDELLGQFKCLVHQQPDSLRHNKDILQHILQESKGVELLVWLIVREYSILSLEYPNRTKHSLLKGLDECFNTVINKKFVVRLVKLLEHDDVVPRVERFIRKHKVELKGKIFRSSQQRSRRSIEDDNSAIESTSGTNKLSSWVNVFADTLVGAVKSISQFISSPFKPAIGMESSKAITTQGADINDTLLLLDVFVRKITGQKYISTVDRSISQPEAQVYASTIMKEFEKVLNETATKSGISVENLNFDPVEVQSAIVGQIVSEKFSKISKTLYSFAKEACPELKQTDKFLAHLKSNLEEKETVLLQQKIEKPSEVLDQQVSRKVELPKRPNTFLNRTSVVKGISSVLER